MGSVGWTPPCRLGPKLFVQAPGNGAMSTEQVHTYKHMSDLRACPPQGGRRGRGWEECSRVFQAAGQARVEAQDQGKHRWVRSRV